MGVDIDIRASGIGDEIPHHGPWDEVLTRGMAGSEHLLKAEEALTYNGETYTLDRAWGTRERTCFGKDWDLLTLIGSGHNWGWCFSETINVFCCRQGRSGQFSGLLFVADRIIATQSPCALVGASCRRENGGGSPATPTLPW
jgi:hypothetical protein